MKIIKIILGFGVLFFLPSCIFNRPPVLKCFCEVEAFKDSIRQRFNADTVILNTMSTQEELYLPEIRAIVLRVVNATTKTLDFKTLPVDYNRLDNIYEIEDGLKEEAKEIAYLLFEKCDTEDINDIVIEFSKQGNDGRFMYRFICHYYRELFPEKWKKYLSND